MVKKVLNSLFTAVAIAFTMNVSAQTFYAGFPFSSSNPVEGTEGRMVSFDLSGLQTVTGEYAKIPTDASDGDSYIHAGTTVGDSYLAFVHTDAGITPYFAWLNFETGTVTKVGNTSYASMKDMTYDPVTETVYGLYTRTTMTGTNTELVAINVTDGTTSVYTTFEGITLDAIAADGTGKAYAIKSVQTGFDFGAYAYDLSLCTVDFAAKTCDDVRAIGSFSGNKNYTSMELNEGTLYYIGGKKLYSINPAEGDMVQLGTLPFSNMTGVTFTKSTADEFIPGGSGTGAGATTAYFALNGTPVADEVTDPNSRVFSFDLTDQTITGEYCAMAAEEDSYGQEEDIYVAAGATVGNRYYAYTTSTYGMINRFATLNFENSEVANIADVSEGVISSLEDMAYNPINSTLYAITSSGTNTTLNTVNLADGTLTAACTLDGVALVAIAADNEGNLYGVAVDRSGEVEQYVYTVNLYSIDAANGACNLVAAVGSPAGAVRTSNKNTMAYNGDKLYFVYGSGIMAFNVDGTGVEDITLPLTTSSLRSVVGLTFTKSTEGGTTSGGDEEEDTGLRLKYEETWGDAMGSSGVDEVTKRKIYYYDQYNNVVRMANYGRMYSDAGGMADEWQIMNYTKYEYDENHRMIESHSQQYGQYSGEDFAFKAMDDTVRYDYDANGRLSHEYTIASGDTINYKEYRYDENGQLVYKAQMNPDLYGTYGTDYYLMSSETYSDFAAFNKPRRVVGDGAYDSYKFVTVNEYDEDNNLVKSTKWNATEEQMQEITYQTWRNDSLVEKLVNRVRYSGEEYTETPKNRYTYECVDGDPNKVRMFSWNYVSSADTFAVQPVSTVSIYGQYDAVYSPTDLVLTPVEGEINSYEISFNAPSVPTFGDVKFNIYRHGIFSGSIMMDDAESFDQETGRFVFTDHNVPNGTYDYMVETMVIDEITGDSTTYNVSNCVEVSPYVELPAVTNLHFVEYQREGSADLITVAWDAPADLDPALMFQRYNVFITQLGMRAAENNEEDGQDTQYTLTFRFDREDIYIQSVYHFGKVNSDTITVDLTDPDMNPGTTEGISDATAGNGKVKVSESQITVDGVASTLLLYSVSGAMEGSYKNVSSVDISGLGRGVYVALVNVDGKNIIMKFRK